MKYKQKNAKTKTKKTMKKARCTKVIELQAQDQVRKRGRPRKQLCLGGQVDSCKRKYTKNTQKCKSINSNEVIQLLIDNQQAQNVFDLNDPKQLVIKNYLESNKEISSEKQISSDDLIIIHYLLDLSNIPDDLGPRELQLQQIQNYIEQQQDIPLFLSGNPASGKTTVIKKILQKNTKSKLIYINAALFHQPQQIFVSIFRQYKNNEKIISAQKAYQNLQQMQLKQKHVNCTIIIDEIDYLSKNNKFDTIYQLLELKNVQLIFIANSLNFLQEVQRIHSRLNLMQEIQFQDYTIDEFKQLLKTRLSNYYNKINENALILLAKRMNLNADLRRFFVSVYLAFDIARKKNSNVVNIQDIQQVSAEKRSFEQFSDLQLVIMDGILKGNRIGLIFNYCCQQLNDVIQLQRIDVEEQLQRMVNSHIIEKSENGQYLCNLQKKDIQQEIQNRSLK